MFTGLTHYDVSSLCFSEHKVELSKSKFSVKCYLGDFDLARQMKEGEDFDLKEKVDLPALAKAVGKNGVMYTFYRMNYLQLLVARQAILNAGFPVFTGTVLGNELGYEIENDDAEPSPSFEFILTSWNFVSFKY